MGQTDVVVLVALDDDDAYAEWQDGVLRAERPADRAMCRSGRGGSEYSVLCVLMKSSERCSQRLGE